MPNRALDLLPPKELKDGPATNQSLEKLPKDAVIQQDGIEKIKNVGGKIEFNQDGILVVSQSDMEEVDLKVVLREIIDFSKYDFQSFSGGYNGSNTRWYITKKDLSLEEPVTEHQRDDMSRRGMTIENNTGNFLSIFQTNEGLADHGNLSDYIEQQLDSRFMIIKSEKFPNGTRFFLKKKPDKKDSVELTDIETEDGRTLDLESELSLMSVFNELCANYPGLLDKIQIFHQENTGSGIIWGTAGPDKRRGINVVEINDLSLQNPDVLRELSNHEYGHLVYNSLPKEIRAKISSIYNRMDRLDPQEIGVLTWFNQGNYVNGRKIGYKGYRSAPNASELYPMVFSALNLSMDKFFKNFYSKGTAEEKALVDELINYMPKKLQERWKRLK